MSRYETRAVPLDDRDRQRISSVRKTNQATIGKLLMRKESFVGRIKTLTDSAKLLVDRCTRELADGVQEMDCRVDLDFHHGQARYIREDTGEIVFSRPLTADERQAVLPLESEPERGSSGTVFSVHIDDIHAATARLEGVARKATVAAPVKLGSKKGGAK